MPRIPPSDQTSLRGAGYSQPDSDADKHTLDIQRKNAATTTAREIERIEARYWHNRLISYCREKIQRFIHPPPSIKVSELVADLSKHCPGNLQKVLAALKLHTGGAIKLHQSEDGKLGFTDGKVAISTKTIDAVIKSIKQSGMETAYEYLRKGKQLPEGYLQQIILPHIHKRARLAIEGGVTPTGQQIQGRKQYRENPDQYINHLLIQAGIDRDSSFTFERMLEFKKLLRNNIALSIEEQTLLTNPNVQHRYSAADDGHKTLQPIPQLTEPEKTDHFIESEDSKFIQELASADHFFSNIRLKDMGNRTKRAFLRNKRKHIFFIGGVIATIVITAFFPPAGVPIGIALAISAAIEINYELFWISGTSHWRRLRLLRGLKQIKKYSNFDHTDFSPENDKKRKRLIRHLRYRCQNQTFSQIYNAYAELEKQGDKLKKLEEKEPKTLSDSMAMEKERALYQQRRKKFDSSLYFFDLLIEQITISRLIVERRNQEVLERLWDEKFKNCNPITRGKIFREVSEDLVIQGHQIVTEEPKWLRNIARYLPGISIGSANEPPEALDLKNAEKSKLFTGAGIVKMVTQETIFRSGKRTIFMNLMDLWKILRKRASITIHNPFTPKPNFAGTSVFLGCIFLEMATSHINSRQNQSRVDDIKNRRKGYTWTLTGKRVRTGREEVSSLRAEAKAEVEPIVSHLLESVESMEKIADTLEDTRQRSKMLGKEPFGAMSDKEAAALILEHAAWQQLLDKEINNAFNTFHHTVQEKAENCHSTISTALTANRKPGISAVFSEQACRQISSAGQAVAGPQKPVRSTLQQLPSEVFLQNIRNTVSGELILRFRKGELSEDQAFREIRAINNLDELLALQFWVANALKEKSYPQNEDMLEKFRRFVTYRINHKSPLSNPSSHQTGKKKPIDPV